MTQSLTIALLCVVLAARPLEGSTREEELKDWPEFVHKDAPQQLDEVELWKCILHGTAVPSHPVMLQQGNEVIVAHKKGGVLLSEEHFDTFRSCMFIGNLNEIADVEMPRRTVKRQVNVPLAWHKSYHNYSEIRNWSEAMATHHPALVRYVPSIGHSHRGVPIFALHVTNDTQNVTDDKPKIYVQCLLHAREWISGAVCQGLVEFLVNPPAQRRALVSVEELNRVKRLLRKLEFVFVPVANPDGYKLTWFRYPIYRLWRKNVASFGPHTCGGVDLNRNFDAYWSGLGHPCTDIFPGLAPHSEPEVASIVEYFTSLKPVLGAIDMHSFQQLVLYPFAYSDEKPPHNRKISNVAFKMARAMSKVNSLNFTSLQAGHWYNAKGTFIDWAFSNNVSTNNTDSLGRSYRVIPIVVELRPRLPPNNLTLAGFLVRPNEILPTCQEAFAGLIKFSQLALAKPIRFKVPGWPHMPNSTWA